MSLNPSAPPVLPHDVFGVGRPNVLVTGAASPLGRAVVDELNASFVPSVGFVDSVAAPPSAKTFRGNAGTGAGLDEALVGVGAVIHVAAYAQADGGAQATRVLVEAMRAWAPKAHLILVSSIGTWENSHEYYREQAESENVARRFAGRVSIVRLAPTHDAICGFLGARSTRTLASTQHVSLAPIDPRWAAQKLVDVALMRHALAVPMELAGPETLTLADLNTLVKHLSGRRMLPRLSSPSGARLAATFADGVHLPDEAASRGGRTFSQWLGARLNA